MPIEPHGGVVLYDGACAFCRNWVLLWKTTLARRGFELAPLQSPQWIAKLGLHPDMLLYDLRLVTRDGRLISGADVYLYVTRRIWWAWIFSVVFSLPGFNGLLHRGYRWFANNRYCISGACRLEVHK